MAENKTAAERLAEARGRSGGSNGVNAMELYARAARKQTENQAVPGGNSGDEAYEPGTDNGGNVLKRIAGTALDVHEQVGRGMWSSLEGILDFAMGLQFLNPGHLLGAKIGDEIFGGDAKETLKNTIEYNITENAYDFLDRKLLPFMGDWISQSYQTGKGGEFAKEIEQGIGGMLPSVAMAMVAPELLGAEAAAALGGAQKVSQAASLATLGLGAAGQGTQEAYQDGAGVYRGLAYGAAEGAKEVATEMMFDGPMEAIYGSGFFDGVWRAAGTGGKKAVMRTAGRLAKDFIGEGIEEAAGEAVEPFLKTIYKGKEAFDGVTVGSQAKAIGKSFVMGGATSLAYAGTVGYGMAKSGQGYVGTEADVNEILEDLEAQKEKRKRLLVDQKAGFEKRVADVDAQSQSLYQELEARLTSVSEAKRAKMIQEFSLDKLVGADGHLVEAVRNPQASGLDERYFTPGADTETIKKAAERAGATVFSGELNEQESRNYTNLRRAEDKLSRLSGETLTFALVDELADGDEGNYVPGENVVLLPRSILSDPEAAGETVGKTWFRKLIHETSHATDGTGARAALRAMLESEDVAWAFERFRSAEYLPEEEITRLMELPMDAELSEADAEKMALLQDELLAFATENALGTRSFMERLIRSDRTAAGRMLNAVSDVLEALKAGKDPVTKAALRKMRARQNAFIHAVEESGFRYEGRKILMAKGEGGEEEAENIRFSKKMSGSFESVVEQVLAMSDEEARENKAEGNFVSVMKETPKILLDNVENAENLEIIMRFDALYLEARKSGVLDGNYHNLGVLTKQIPRLLSDPDAVVRMDNGRLNIISELKTEKGDNGVVSVELSTIKNIEGEYSKYNLIISAFSSKPTYIRNLLKKHGVSLEYEKRDLSQVNHQLHESLAIIDEKSLADSIAQRDSVVNRENEEIRKSKQARDSEYLSAVKRGDTRTAQRLVDEAAELAFSESRIRDESGKLIKVYHGSDESFTVFDRTKGRANMDIQGLFFSPDMAEAEGYGENVRAFYLNITNPADYSTGYAAMKAHKGENGAGIKAREDLERNGYDGVDNDGEEYIAFASEQIKSADPVTYDDSGRVIPLSERFNTRDPDIRKSKKKKTPTAEQMAAMEEKRAEFERLKGMTEEERLEYAKKRRAEAEERRRMDAEEVEADQTRREAEERWETSVAANETETGTFRLNKYAANTVFSREDATGIVEKMAKVLSDTLYDEATELEPGRVSMIRTATLRSTANTLWERLNNAQTNKERVAAADAAAEMLLMRTLVKDSFSETAIQAATERLEVWNQYIRKLDVNALKNEFKDDEKAILRRWKAKKGAESFTPDQIKSEVEERLGITIQADHPADILKEMNRLYEQDKAVGKAAFKAFADATTNEFWQETKRKVAQEVLEGFRTGGSVTSIHEIMMDVETADRRLGKLRRDLSDQVDTQYYLNRAWWTANQIRNWKTGEFEAVSQIGNRDVLAALGELARVNYRGNTSVTGTRNAMAKVLKWYSTPEVKEWLGAKKKGNVYVDGGYYYAVIEDMVRSLAAEVGPDGKPVKKGALTLEDAKALSQVLDYFHKVIEDAHKVRVRGKIVDAKAYAAKAREGILANANVLSDRQIGLWVDKYLEEFGDPMTVMRYFDGYADGGFLTTALEDLRAAERQTDLYKYDMLKQIDDFDKEHKSDGKGYLDRAEKKTVMLGGKKIPLMVGMYLTLALQRQQAIPHLMKNGFVYLDEAGKNARGEALMRVDGKTTMEEMTRKANELTADLMSQMAEEDISFIKLAYKIFNVDCKELKRKTDIARMGWSNVEEGVYIPIRIAEKAVRVDTGSTFRDEVDRATNAGFNKQVTEGAKNKIVAGNLLSVMRTHIDGVSRYAGLSEVIRDLEVVLNVDVGENAGDPVTVKRALDDTWGRRTLKGFGERVEIRGAVAYLTKMIEDVQKISNRQGVTLLDDVGDWLRGKAAVAMLGANPKVLATQFSSLIAAANILDPKHIRQGLAMKANGAELDKYCRLAELRNADSVAAKSQTLVDQAAGRIGELSMALIGKCDRVVVTRLWNACLLEVAEKQHMAITDEACKVAAGELLMQVIYETQQNSQATERSYAMRSTSALAKVFTMFSADSMKMIGRVIDGAGEVRTLTRRLASATDEKARAEMTKKLEAAKTKRARAVGTLMSQAVYMAVIASIFRKLLAYDDDDTLTAWSWNDLLTFGGDVIGSALGGLPIIKDVVEAVGSGYGLEEMGLSSFNDLLSAFTGLLGTAGKLAGGEATSQDVVRTLRTSLFAVAKFNGIPLKNVQKYTRGLVNLAAPDVVYRMDSIYTSKSYAKDLAAAIEAGNEDRASMIAGIMMDQRVDLASHKSVRAELVRLAGAGQTVLPKTVGTAITYDGETYKLTARQRREFEAVYAQASEAAERLVSSAYYKSCSESVKASALKRLYDLYYNKGMEEALGVDLESRAVLFSAAIPPEILLCAAAQAAELTSDVGRDGKPVSGSKKLKVQKFVQSLRLTAVQKWMVYAYLGYSAEGGKAQVRAYIQSLKMSKKGKEELWRLCGF